MAKYMMEEKKWRGKAGVLDEDRRGRGGGGGGSKEEKNMGQGEESVC